MGSKIKNITVVNLQGSCAYRVGNEYNGLLLDYIKDKSMEYPDSMEIIYMGFTASGDIVFEVINAPVSVEYAPA